MPAIKSSRPSIRGWIHSASYEIRTGRLFAYLTTQAMDTMASSSDDANTKYFRILNALILATTMPHTRGSKTSNNGKSIYVHPY